MADEKAAQPAKAQDEKKATPKPAVTAEETADRGSKRQLSGAELDESRRLGTTTGGTTEAQQHEFKELGVNPRLDNRTGDQRPVLADAVKPQQVDGPEVGHFAEHAERFAEEAKKVVSGAVKGKTVGSKAEGPHGRGPHGVTVGDEHGQPVDVQGGAGDEHDPRNPA